MLIHTVNIKNKRIYIYIKIFYQFVYFNKTNINKKVLKQANATKNDIITV